MTACVRGLPHDFDPFSGWCLGGCGWRENHDGTMHRAEPVRRAAHAGDYVDVTEPRRGGDDL